MADVFIRMLKNASGPNFGPFKKTVPYYKVPQAIYEQLRAGFACRKVRETDRVRKLAKPVPLVEGGGDALYARKVREEEEFDDAPLPPEPAPSAGIISDPPVTPPAPQASRSK